MAWRVLLILVLGICDLALFGKMVWGPGGIVEYCDLKQQFSGIKQQITELDSRNMALSRDIRLLQSDSQYVEKMVRQKLRYLHDNEIVYLFPDRNAKNGATNQ